MRKLTNQGLILTASLLVVGCGASGGRPQPTTEVRPKPAATITRNATTTSLAESWDSQVLLQRRDSLVLTLPDGSRQVQVIGRDLQFTLQLKNRALTIRLDTLALLPNAPALAAEAIGTVWTGKIGAFGRLEDLSPSRSGILVEEITNAVATLVPRLPRAGAAVGERWSDTTQRTLRVEIFRTQEQRTTDWQAHAATKGDGIRVVPISIHERFEQIGDGVSANRKMKMTAQGRRSGVYYLTSDGRVDRAAMADTIAKLITIPESKQSIPTMQYSRTLIRYRPLVGRGPND